MVSIDHIYRKPTDSGTHSPLVPTNETIRQWIEDIESLPGLRFQTQRLRRFADAPLDVLITGESGVGKEYIAQYVCAISDRADKPFVAANCAAIPRELLEAQAFGSVKGAYTSSNRDVRGLFQMAEGGVLFLDEIGDASFDFQAKLLRVLSSRQALRVGDDKPYRIDCRIVTATNKSIPEMIEQGRFREDLYFRLNQIEVEIPPLRERKEDIPVLADRILRAFCNDVNRVVPVVTDDALLFLMSFNWPGNARQMANVLKRCVYLADDSRITAELFQQECKTKPAVPLTLAGSMRQYEKNFIGAILSHTQGNLAEAARVLRIPGSTLRDKVKKLGLLRSTRVQRP